MRDGRIRAVNINPGGKRPTWRIVAASLEAFRVEPLGVEVLEERLREADGGYTAYILEFPGCITEWSDFVGAAMRLENVAIGWIAASLDLGQDIPEPKERRGIRRECHDTLV